VRVFGGDAGAWEMLRRISIVGGTDEQTRSYEIESSRAYRDRLVLKIRGIDDAAGAAALRGRTVVVAAEDAPELGEGEYYNDLLVGMEVRDEAGTRLGRVRAVWATGGVDLLVIDRARPGGEDGEIAEELLVPMAAEIVVRVEESRGRIVIRPPEGLLDLGRKE
jgi:16S rRNA processing protein RimM